MADLPKLPFIFMTIKLSFLFQREPVFFVIEDKKVRYYDRKWETGVQFLPKDVELIKKLVFSRNRIPMSKQILDWIHQANSGDNLKEYEACNTDEDIAQVVIRDARKKGLVYIEPIPSI